MMNDLPFARTPAAVSTEAARLRRFMVAYEKLIELVPDGSPLGQQAAGAVNVIDWLFNDSEPALSDVLEDVLRYGLVEIGRQRRGA